MLESPLLIVLAVSGAVFCTGYLALQAFDRYETNVHARVHELAGGRNTPLARSETVASGGARRDVARPGSLAKARESFWKHLVPTAGNEVARYQSRLLQAGIYSPRAVSTLFAVKILLMVVPPLGGLLIGGFDLARRDYSVLGGCLLGSVGMLAPSFWLECKIRQRHGDLRRSVPDFLDLMTVCLEGGLSLQGAIQRVGQELLVAHPMLAGELSIVQRDLDLGLNVDGALRRLAERTGFDGLKSLSSFVRESQRLGTELAQALRIHADTLRVQREQGAEEQAQKASVKILFPTLLLILPAVFVVLAGPAAIQIQEAFAKR